MKTLHLKKSAVQMGVPHGYTNGLDPNPNIIMPGGIHRVGGGKHRINGVSLGSVGIYIRAAFLTEVRHVPPFLFAVLIDVP